MYARGSKVMAQFVLKIEKLSHIMVPTPILEMARAYGLRPRLWLLVTAINHLYIFFCRIPVVLESRRSSQEGGGGAHPCTLPLDPPLLSVC